VKVGILTGGGDCPGLNGIIRGAVVAGVQKGWKMVGLKDGWKGLLEKLEVELTIDDVEDIHRIGGTMLGTSRTNLFKNPELAETAKKSFKEMGLDALIATGGEDTLGVCKRFTDEGFPMVGCPKTIDNDVNATDFTFGYNSAIQLVSEYFDTLHTTAKSHHRIMVVEVMGRHAGWMTLEGGMAGGAHIILLPEKTFTIKDVVNTIKERQKNGKDYHMIAVSEGAMLENADEEGLVLQEAEKDDFGHVRLGGIGKQLAKILGERTGIEARHVVLGHLQRGNRPCAFDRVITLRMGAKAIELIEQKKFGYLTALRGTKIEAVPLQDALGTLKTVPDYRIKEMEIFKGL
jgi:6-phosphofructokinase 1